MNELIPRQIVTIAFVLAIGAGSIYLGLSISQDPTTGLGLFIGLVAAAASFITVFSEEEDRHFQMRLLFWALGLRWLMGLAIYYWHLQMKIGPDVITYDGAGDGLSQVWHGLADPLAPWLLRHININRSGWGMNYYVAAVYYVIDRNPLAIQLINCALGAVTCVFVYRIAFIVYPNQRVARLASILTAISPSMVLWTSQGLKEAPIVFCLSLCSLCTLKLCRKFNIGSLVLLLLMLFCLFALRHYAFVITSVATASAFLFSAKKFTPKRMLQGVVLVVIIGMAFVYFGADEVTEKTLNLERLQVSRKWGATAANSGYGGNVDVTEARSALIYLPLGIVYVLSAPLPWMINNLGQLATLPEMLIWWIVLPLMLKGYWFAIRQRLAESLPLCLFTLGLTLVYALFQTNAGTVHRQRAQLFPFFFIFVSIGWEQWRDAVRTRRAQAAKLHLAYGHFSHSPVPMRKIEPNIELQAGSG